MASQETGLSKLIDRMSDQQKREHIAADERKRTIANRDRVDVYASIQNPVPHILKGIQAGPEEK